MAHRHHVASDTAIAFGFVSQELFRVCGDVGHTIILYIRRHQEDPCASLHRFWARGLGRPHSAAARRVAKAALQWVGGCPRSRLNALLNASSDW